MKHGLPLDRQRVHVEARIRQGLRKKSFDAGNGEKVLKRWLGLAAKTGAVVKPEVLEDLIKRRPSVRENVYSFIRSRPLTPSIAGILARASQSGLLVDDAAMVEMSNYLVETFVKNKRCHAMLEAVIASNDPQSYFGLYSRLWLLSKYGTPAQILTTLRDARNIWSPHERLGRLAASFLPLFHGSPEEKPLKRLLADTLNSGVRDTYKFHMKLATDLPTFKAMFDALKAPNPSRGTGITHAKFLCLLSALKNPAAPVAQITTLRANHSRAFEDAYYKEISKRVGV